MIEFRVKMGAPSTPNLREHHMARARRVKAQRGAVSRKMPPWDGPVLLAVRITRIAPRLLDGDNLQGAMKAIRDAVAAKLRIDDGSPLIAWLYHQTSGAPEVVVQIWAISDYEPGCTPLVPVGGPTPKRTRTVKGERKPGTNAKAKPGYIPPRQPPGDARLAEVFAPPPQCECGHPESFHPSFFTDDQRPCALCRCKRLKAKP